MNFINLLTLLTSFSIAFGEGSVEDSVVQLKFNLREERLPAIVNYLLNNSLEERNITTGDIIQLSKLDKFSLEDIVKVFDYFNTSIAHVFTVDSLETVLDDLDTEFLDFYRTLIKELNLDDQKTQQVLNDLAIPQLKFLMAVVSESYIYDILREGLYDEAHVNAALQTVGRSGSEVYAIVRDILKERVLHLSSSNFVNILKEHGWNRQTSRRLWEALNITTRDLYAVEKFKEIFTGISDGLNKNMTIGVFVGEKKLAIHELVYQQFENTVDGITIKIEAKEVEVAPKASGKLGENIVELTTKQERQNFIEITENYNSTDSCIYVTFNGETLVAKRVEVNEEIFAVEKTPEIIFNLGSPLICQGYLHGLAQSEEEGTIMFDKFYVGTEAEEAAAAAEEEESQNSASRSSTLLLVLVFNLFMCFVLF